MRDYPSYRAPHPHRSRLCVPELDQVGKLLEGNRQLFEVAACRWMDVPLSTIRQWAREEALVQAQAYSQRYIALSAQELADGARRREGDSRSVAPLILSGHQPELYHPGVWFKNFLLASIAKTYSGIGIHILVDHDLARTFVLNVPAIGPDGMLRKETLSVDAAGPAWPWEHTRPQDIAPWKRLYASVIERLLSIGITQPLMIELWPRILRDLEQGWPLGEALSAARHVIERSYGLETLELPFSRLASERSFACFVGEFLSRIESTQAVYNAARQAYRRQHRIQNHLQPIPGLARDGDWFEAPFWVYSASDPTRRPLWIVRDRGRLRLSDRRGWQVSWPGNASFDEWFAEWRTLTAAKVSIRPRALTTTAYLRLAVSDLFIHGIGGGAYDQMTDHLVQSLWQLAAPSYLVATATLHLPMSVPDRSETRATSHSVAEVSQRIRDWKFAPEKLCPAGDSDSALALLLKQKAKLLSQIPAGQAKASWHREIQQLNARLRQRSPVTEAALAEQLRDAQRRERERAILSSREFSLALFPANAIVAPLKGLCEIRPLPGSAEPSH